MFFVVVVGRVEKCKRVVGPWGFHSEAAAWEASVEKLWHLDDASFAGFGSVVELADECHFAGRANCHSWHRWTWNKCPCPCLQCLAFWAQCS